MNKRQKKKYRKKAEWAYYRTHSYNEMRKLDRECHERNVAVNQKTKLLIMEQKQHTSMWEDILIGAYVPPRYRWRTIILKAKNIYQD